MKNQFKKILDKIVIKYKVQEDKPIAKTDSIPIPTPREGIGNETLNTTRSTEVVKNPNTVKETHYHKFIHPPPNGPISIGLCVCGKKDKSYNSTDRTFNSAWKNDGNPNKKKKK